MSWAEVKKINSNLNKPLDKLFGFEFFKYFALQSFKVSGVKGMALVYNSNASANGSFFIDGHIYYAPKTSTQIVFFSESLENNDSKLLFMIFTLGGGIS